MLYFKKAQDALKNISKINRLKQILDGYFEAQSYNIFTTLFHNDMLNTFKSI
jgi:hypothetical protein